jgi:sterol 3beta-glucosyltransferase
MMLPGDESSKLLHTGAATIHRHNPVFANKTSRVWMELDSEMITTYPSADEEGRVKPLRSILRE